MRTTQVSEIIVAGYRLSGVQTAPGRGPGPNMLQEGVEVLNDILDDFSAERLWIFAKPRSVWNTNSNQQVYTIGTDITDGPPDFITERPARIEQAGYIFTDVTPQIEQQFQILNQQQWAALSPKDTPSTIAYMMYYEPAIPNGKIWLWPTPSRPWQIALYLWQSLTLIGGSDDTMFLPQAYKDALQYNLGVRLNHRYPGANMAPGVEREAIASRARVKNLNDPALLMQVEAGAMGVNNAGAGNRYSILSNQYNL